MQEKKLEQYHQVWHIYNQTQVLVLKVQEPFKPVVGRQRQIKRECNEKKRKTKTRIDHSEVHPQRKKNIQINT